MAEQSLETETVWFLSMTHRLEDSSYVLMSDFALNCQKNTGKIFFLIVSYGYRYNKYLTLSDISLEPVLV